MVVSAYDSDLISYWDSARFCPRFSIGAVYIYNILRLIFPFRRLLVGEAYHRERSERACGWLGILGSASVSRHFYAIKQSCCSFRSNAEVLQEIIVLPKVSMRDGGQARGSTLALAAPEGPR